MVGGLFKLKRSGSLASFEELAQILVVFNNSSSDTVFAVRTHRLRVPEKKIEVFDEYDHA
jgi:hypothetical protein